MRLERRQLPKTVQEPMSSGREKLKAAHNRMLHSKAPPVSGLTSSGARAVVKAGEAERAEGAEGANSTTATAGATDAIADADDATSNNRHHRSR